MRDERLEVSVSFGGAARLRRQECMPRCVHLRAHRAIVQVGKIAHSEGRASQN